MQQLLILTLALSMATVLGGPFSEERDGQQLNALIESLFDLAYKQNNEPGTCKAATLANYKPYHCMHIIFSLHQLVHVYIIHTMQALYNFVTCMPAACTLFNYSRSH